MDRGRDELAVSRQLEDCRQLAADRGWTVTAEYVDNDRSATTGLERPQFERMLRDRPEQIVVWHTDRLVRVIRDLERVIDLAVNVHAVKAGHVDLSNPAGRAVARTVTAWSQYEGEQKALRQRAKNLQRARSGSMPTSGGRPFGYVVQDKRFVIDPTEADHFKRAVRQVLNGATLMSVVRDFNDRGVTTTVGVCDTCGHRAPANRGTCGHDGCTGTVRPNMWRPTTMRSMLTNPRYAAIVTYGGEQYPGDPSLAIITEDEHRHLVSLFNSPERKRPGRPNRYLLSGIALCAVCGHPVNGTVGSTRTKAPTYKCLNGFHFNRQADPINEHVTDVVLTALRHRAQAPWLYAHTPADGDTLRDLTEREQALTQRMDDMSTAYVDGALTMAQLTAATARAREALVDIQARREALARTDSLPDLLPDADVRAVWDDMDLDRQRAVIRDLCSPRIAPQGKGVRTFNPGTVTFDWRGRPPHVVVSCVHRPDVAVVRETNDDGTARGWAPVAMTYNPVTKTLMWEEPPADPCCIPSDADLEAAVELGRLHLCV